MKTRSIIFIIILLSNSWSFAQKSQIPPVGTLSGLITMNEAGSTVSSPDAGSEVLVINVSDREYQKSGDLSVIIDNYQKGKTAYYVELNSTIDPVRLSKAHANFERLTIFTSNQIRAFRKLPAIVTTNTDATGMYSLSLSPGRYFILVTSGNIRAKNIAEGDGIFKGHVAEVKASGRTTLNLNFQKDEMMWLRFMTAMQPEGC